MTEGRNIVRNNKNFETKTKWMQYYIISPSTNCLVISILPILRHYFLLVSIKVHSMAWVCKLSIKLWSRGILRYVLRIIINGRFNLRDVIGAQNKSPNRFAAVEAIEVIFLVKIIKTNLETTCQNRQWQLTILSSKSHSKPA